MFTTKDKASTDDLRIIGCEEVATMLGMSLRSLERRCAAGEGPRVTKLSTRKKGIRADHLREWLDNQQA
jgi:predicted DNA-binding transcriptional regulator AlpA